MGALKAFISMLLELVQLGPWGGDQSNYLHALRAGFMGGRAFLAEGFLWWDLSAFPDPLYTNLFHICSSLEWVDRFIEFLFLTIFLQEFFFKTLSVVKNCYSWPIVSLYTNLLHAYEFAGCIAEGLSELIDL